MFIDNKKKKNMDLFAYYSESLKTRKQKQLHKLKALAPLIPKNTESHQKQNVPTQSSPIIHSGSIPEIKVNLLKDATKDAKENWVKLDSKAYIINGKLFYIKNDDGTANFIENLNKDKECMYSKSLQNQNSSIVELLKIHNIPLSQYIYGDRQKILHQIAESDKKQKDETIEKYISKNMRDQDEVKVVVSNWHHKNKYQLFND